MDAFSVCEGRDGVICTNRIHVMPCQTDNFRFTTTKAYLSECFIKKTKEYIFKQHYEIHDCIPKYSLT